MGAALMRSGKFQEVIQFLEQNLYYVKDIPEARFYLGASHAFLGNREAAMRELAIPCGVIINRAGIGDSGVEEYCRKEGIPVLLTIPLDTDIARQYSRGITLVEGMPQWQDGFHRLFESIQERVDERACRSER